MGRYRIHCKNHDSNDRVIEVGIAGDRNRTKDEVWNLIKTGTNSYYTTEKGYVADVIAALRDGRKYLTTERDGITDNNLDELPRCS